MRKITTVVCLCILTGSLLLPSCATMFGKSTYPLSINTNPSGANIQIIDQKGINIYSGTSPATVLLKSSGGYLKSATYNIRFSYPGYNSQNVYVISKMNKWYWGNILFGGLIGMLIVDPLTGSMYKIENAPINITLVKKEGETDITKNELNIIDIKDVPEDMKEYLVKIN